MAPRRSAPVRIDLVRVLELLRTHSTAALCQTVFATVRITERQRQWTLEALVQFWLAVILRAPRALSQALYETFEGSEPLFPHVQASPEAFFQRCQTLRPAFFARGVVFAQFTHRLLRATPARYALDVAPIQARFAAICVIRWLPARGHRPPVESPLERTGGCAPGVPARGFRPGGRGLCRTLEFCLDAAGGELTRAKAALVILARESLVLGGRLYGTGVWFAALAAQGCWGLVRRNRRLGLRKTRRLGRYASRGGRLDDRLVEAGGSRATPVQVLRYIRWRRGATVRAVLTNVLDPTRLSAAEALALYPHRWTVERLFFNLKGVLNLNRVYAANPNAVAMETYAAGCVYNAMRVAQAEMAEAAGVPPEAISPAKFFPKMAAACHAYALFELWFLEAKRLNPGQRLRKRPATERRFASVTLGAILVESRKKPRRKRRFCAARRRWKSLSHLRGRRKILKLT